MPTAIKILVGLIGLSMAGFFLLVNPAMGFGLIVTALLLGIIYRVTHE